MGSGPGSGGTAGGSGSSSSVGGNFIGRAFTVGRHQVTVEETLAEGKWRCFLIFLIWFWGPVEGVCFKGTVVAP